MAKPITLSNGRHWKTRKAAEDHFIQMLARYTLDEIVHAGADHDDLVALLQHYDRVVESGQPTKIGVGIERFTKGQARGMGYTSECFFVHRLDGSSDDFSIGKAISS
ncbi:DUF3223 domain-containing protein [Achromobacter aegrifaciens]|uniref:DUF3223 domain-containing protein n=1 Tax=Achromobacter aegrifaciens TaxID=1287736 RepID=UPI0027BA7015|nr:DUF3223 domain-containing protein [Achromobacter aegrifaciens]WLW61889.1 DUF3223 domain-containing protein [Achromobacter aegrifaciens]